MKREIKHCSGNILYCTSAGGICPHRAVFSGQLSHTIVSVTWQPGKTAKLGSRLSSVKHRSKKKWKSKVKGLGRVIQLYKCIMIFNIQRKLSVG